MRAMLTTLCKCEREINTTHPPPLEIHLPINDRGDEIINDLKSPPETVPYKIRVFKLHRELGDPFSPLGVAYYREQP